MEDLKGGFWRTRSGGVGADGILVSPPPTPAALWGTAMTNTTAAAATNSAGNAATTTAPGSATTAGVMNGATGGWGGSGGGPPSLQGAPQREGGVFMSSWPAGGALISLQSPPRLLGELLCFLVRSS